MAKADRETINPNESFTKLQDRIDGVILDSRRIFLTDAVDNRSADDIIRKLWYLELTAPGKPILFVINSPGGAVDSGFAIWDQIKLISSPVTTLVTGMAASFGSVLGLCAAPNRRFATSNARFMIHQPRVSGAIQGQATDLEIHAKEILKSRQKLVDIYVHATGKDPKTIEESIDRDTWLNAEEAKAFGLIDGIVKSAKDLN